VFKSDVLDLPPKRFKRHYIDLSGVQTELYKSIKKTGAYELTGTQVTVKNVLEMALRLHQVCGGFSVTKREERYWSAKAKEYLIRQVSDSVQLIDAKDNPKIREVLSVIRDKPDEQYLIWCVYRPEIAAVYGALCAEFPGMKVSQLHGDFNEDEREAIVQQFQTKSSQVLISNQQTGGTGYNLTAAETVIYFNNTFSLTHREQSEDRAHRQGLKHSVLYIDIVASNTIDELIIRSLTEKKDLSDYIRSRLGEADRLLGTGQSE